MKGGQGAAPQGLSPKQQHWQRLLDVAFGADGVGQRLQHPHRFERRMRQQAPAGHHPWQVF